MEPPHAAPAPATATPPSSPDDARVRDLFNLLRSGDHGVGFEAFVGAFYFLQHCLFSVFDIKEAFASSSSSSGERFLSYREFQYALTKIARAFAMTHSSPQLTNDSNANDAVLLVRLLDALVSLDAYGRERRMDSVRRQLTKPSVLAVLDQHLPKLVQSFQLYNGATAVPTNNALYDMSRVITLDGFVDFLNGYVEYEEFVSFQELERLARQVMEPFLRQEQKNAHELDFPQFVELFCRVASQFHVWTLEREGAQLRKAVESCRLEFSIELLMEKMDIRQFKDQRDGQGGGVLVTKNDATRAVAQVALPGYESDVSGIEALTLDSMEEEGQDSLPVLPKESLLRDLRMLLDAGATKCSAKHHATKHKQRPQSVLFSRLPPRKTRPETERSHSRPSWLDQRQEDSAADKKPWEPPQMTLIREVISPPPLPSNILKRLEYAITYQNTGQFHMALGALHRCRSLYKECRDKDPLDETEVRVYFSVMTASVYDSARNDQRALAMYLDALRAAERLLAVHPGRALVKSCLGCMLYYMDELVLAKQCHEQVLKFRRNCPDSGDDHVDTATAMSNLACCLSQNPQGTAIEEAYLLLKTAKRIYYDRCGPSHPRVETVSRNFDRVLASQRMVVVDPVAALARGEFAHVIPGSRFQIKALVQVKPAKSGTKKAKKGAKVGKKKK